MPRIVKREVVEIPRVGFFGSSFTSDVEFILISYTRLPDMQKVLRYMQKKGLRRPSSEEFNAYVNKQPELKRWLITIGERTDTLRNDHWELVQYYYFFNKGYLTVATSLDCDGPVYILAVIPKAR